MTAADAYDRPPYRGADPPQQRGGGAQGVPWVLDVFLPWRLARRVYGPFRLFRFTAADAVGLFGGGVLAGTFGRPVAVAAAENTLDPVIERLLLPRALLGLGLLVFVIRLATGTGMNDMIDDAFGDSLLMLATGPASLLLACVPIVALARPGTHRTVVRLVTRPLLTALITGGICGLFVYWATHNGANFQPHSISALLLILVLGPWFVVFFGSVLFLIHRNAFSVGGHPLVRPLACVPLVWLTAVGHALFMDHAYVTPDADPPPAYFLALFAGPLGVTLTAVAEVVLLRRRHGVGFRGPIPGWTPPPHRITPLPGDLVERLGADVARGHLHAWPRVTDRNGVEWAVTPAIRARQPVVWPCVRVFTEAARPMLYSDLAATAGPLNAGWPAPGAR